MSVVKERSTNIMLNMLSSGLAMSEYRGIEFHDSAESSGRDSMVKHIKLTSDDRWPKEALSSHARMRSVLSGAEQLSYQYTQCTCRRELNLQRSFVRNIFTSGFAVAECRRVKLPMTRRNPLVNMAYVVNPIISLSHDRYGHCLWYPGVGCRS